MASGTTEGKWCRDHDAIHRHAARFILLGLYTGTRHGALVSIQWLPNTSGGWLDLEQGVMHRRGDGAQESKKRQPPVRLGRRILSHARRWSRIDGAQRTATSEAHTHMHVIAWKGRPIKKLRRAWDTARERAGLDMTVTPHILRHTRATWLMQAGIEPWEAAGALGMSVKMLETVYGHHHPDWQSKAAEV